MTTRLRPIVRLAFFGFALGATVSAMGFSDYGELHRMFTLADPRLFFGYAGAIVLAGTGFKLHCPPGSMPARPLQAGTAAGALLFGVGWALCGGCPGAVLVQIGEGKVAAFLTLGGILAGAWAGQRIKGALRWDSGSCAS